MSPVRYQQLPKVLLSDSIYGSQAQTDIWYEQPKYNLTATTQPGPLASQPSPLDVPDRVYSEAG